jgi:BASS family bile acid:Na+ symporter
MTMDRLINVLLNVTLIEMMVAIGLGVTLGDLSQVARNWWLIARSAVANYVVVPALAVGLLLLFNPHPMVSVGFLILAVCPGAPYGPPFTAIARGNMPIAVGMMAVLAGSSALLAPLLLYLLLPLVSEGQPLTVDATRIVITLLATQLVPLCVGLAVRWRRPGLAERLQGPANQVCKVLNLVAVALILVAQYDLLLDIRPRGFVGMAVLVVGSWVAGWLLGGPDAETRRTMTLTTSLRNVGVGLVIASGAFAGTPAVTATLAYGLFAVVASLFLALGWARVGSGRSTYTAGAQPPSVEPLTKSSAPQESTP